MNTKTSLFLLLGLCITFSTFVYCEQADEYADEGVTVEDESVSGRFMTQDNAQMITINLLSGPGCTSNRRI